MSKRDPLTRYWFIDQLARSGQLASIDADGYITRPLQPNGPKREVPQPRPHVYLGPPVPLLSPRMAELFRQADATHSKPDWWW